MNPGRIEDDCIYGPVPSRRLGRSLGIDLVPFKTCTYDCVYCQLGRTTNRTIERREYVSADAVLARLERKLATGDSPDFISLAGSGEPTLNSGISRLLPAIKRMTDIPVAVITNGSLLWMDEVQTELLAADVVLPSLDAGDAPMFERINRPDPAIAFELMVEGLATFAEHFDGETWLEVMLLAGLTDVPAEATKIAALVREIGPTRIQLNTASRPAVDSSVRPVLPEQMAVLVELFGAGTDVVPDSVRDEGEATGAGGARKADIVALLARRPCSADDIAAGLGLHTLDVLKHLDTLLADGRIGPVAREGTTYYELRSQDSGSGTGSNTMRDSQSNTTSHS